MNFIPNSTCGTEGKRNLALRSTAYGNCSTTRTYNLVCKMCKLFHRDLRCTEIIRLMLNPTIHLHNTRFNPQIYLSNIVTSVATKFELYEEVNSQNNLSNNLEGFRILLVLLILLK